MEVIIVAVIIIGVLLYNHTIDKDKFIKDNTKESNWLKENAHKYGFILRYESTTEKITGYMYEPWHYRYVGVDIATFIHKNKITYDEYVARNK